MYFPIQPHKKEIAFQKSKNRSRSHQEVTKKVTQIKYRIISINYKFTDFVKTFKKSGKRRNCVTEAALKTPLFIHDNKFDGYHKKNHFVFYTARHRIFK